MSAYGFIITIIVTQQDQQVTGASLIAWKPQGIEDGNHRGVGGVEEVEAGDVDPGGQGVVGRQNPAEILGGVFFLGIFENITNYNSYF